MSRTRIDRADALGTQPIGQLLWHACSQTTMSVGVYGIYALTNAWFVARGVGPEAMAAVNLVAPVLLVLGAVATTVGVGGASLVSRSLGAGSPEAAGRAAGNAFVVFWATAVVVTVLGLVAIEPLLTLLGARGELRATAHDYAVIIIGGAIFATGFSSLIRAEGRMRYSSAVWVVAIVVQIVLDPLLIFGLDLGVRGAALGTVGGQAVSAAMAAWFFFLQRDRPYRVGLAELRPRLATIAAVVGVGAPSFLAGFGATVLAVVVNTTLATAGGASALAAYAVCARIQTFAFMPQLGISQGLQPVVGYNAGRGSQGRVSQARTLALRASVLYGVVVAATVVLLAGPLTAAFIDASGVAATARDALRVIAIGLVVAGIAPLVSAYFQSLGRPRPSYLISIGTLLAIKIPLVIALGRSGTTGVWIALAAGELATALIALAILRLRGR